MKKLHCTAGQSNVETLGSLFANPKREASCNYCIDMYGVIGLIVDERDRSWCSSNRDNDNRAITIEVSSDSKPPYTVLECTMESLIYLLVDICHRNEIKQLLWKADKTLIGKIDKQNMTVHRWFAQKECPGDFLYNKMGEIADKVNQILDSSKKSKIVDRLQTISNELISIIKELNEDL